MTVVQQSLFNMNQVRKNKLFNFFLLSQTRCRHPRQKGTVEVPHRIAEEYHCRTQSELGRIVPHPSHLIRVYLTKVEKTSNRNLAQGQQTDVVHTTTSYFDPVWNAFSEHVDGSMQWIPKQIVTIGEGKT
jgi:hypothetical protein